MRNKIAFKLTLYFSVALLLFSLIIGSVFISLFKSHTIQLHKDDLEKRAITIAATLSEYTGGGPASGLAGGRQGGYGVYLRLLDEIAMTDVWVVDENLELITGGHMVDQQYIYADLPQDAEEVVKEVFQGKTTFSEGFSELMSTPTLTVGTPIMSERGIVGALLLHSPVEGMNEAVAQGFETLIISVLIALVVSILLSVVLALAFTKPLKKMKNTALCLAEGKYNAKTGVRQNDEIGELAAVLDVLSERLEKASRESEKLLQLRRDFVANISHELRTPVTVIRGSLEALCDDIVTDPQLVKSYLQQMLNESIFLQRLVDDLLDLSRLQNTDFQMDMQQINLCDVLNDAIRSAQHLAQPKQVTIQQEQDAQVCQVYGDYGRLRQMLLVILDNAVKFSPQGGTVTVTLKDKKLSISDRGIGIPAQDLPYIFDRFYKVKSGHNKSGTGLGLAIAKQIADRHHINVSIDSKENEGTEFRFEL